MQMAINEMFEMAADIFESISAQLAAHEDTAGDSRLYSLWLEVVRAEGFFRKYANTKNENGDNNDAGE